MHIIQYMKGGGTISPHKDPIVYQKIQLGSVLNELGKDFNSGGFSVFNKKKEKVFIELKSIVAIVLFLLISLMANEIDLSKSDGRWYLSFIFI